MSSAHPYSWRRADGSTGRAWRAKWVGADGRGQSKRGFERKRDAEGYAADREAEVRHGVVLAETAPSGRMTLQDWSRTWLSVQRVRPSTLLAYTYAVARVNADLGGRPLASLRPTELKAWRSSLEQQERYAPSTMNQTAAVLAMMLRAAVLDGLLPASPWPRKTERTEVRLLDPAELLTLEQVQAWGEAMPLVAREMPLFAALTGLRQGEQLGLRLPQVSFLGRTVEVVEQLLTPTGAGGPRWGPPKTRAGYRVVPLPQPAAEALARHLERQPAVDGEPLFRGSRGQRWRRGTFGDVWRRARDEAGLPNWATWHSLRDVFASSLIFTRQDSHLITTLMGHSSPAELAPYARLWPEAQDRARQALEGLWSDGGEGNGTAAL